MHMRHDENDRLVLGGLREGERTCLKPNDDEREFREPVENAPLHHDIEVTNV